jgi:4-hydroxythreonine-4-phosphate dehydrogenase
MATKDAVSGKLQALVTGPLNKQNVNTASIPFNGHTEYLAQQAKSDHLMLLTSDNLRVALITGHLPLKEVSARLSQSLITEKIMLLNQSLIKDFGIIKPKIAVLGLNPHAGENGLLGAEEKEIIIPAVDKIRNDKQITVFGPYPADGFFGSNQYKQFDGILAMYHDQGLIPFKFMAFKDGVNYTAGLPFIRTSPDHGTAYAIAGKNEADAQSMRNAIYLAIDIWARRNHFQTINENPLPMTQFRREKFRIDF